MLRDHKRVFFRGLLFAAILMIANGAAFATAVADTMNDQNKRSVTDGLGRDVLVPEYPTRIVVAGNASFMVADALYLFDSAPDRVVGITRISQARGNFLPEIDPGYGDKVVFERNVGPEQIAAATPDVVFMKSFMKERLGNGVERLGIPVVYVDFETPLQYKRDLLILGAVLGELRRAERLSRYYQDVLSAVSARTAGIPDAGRPTTLFIYADATGSDVAFNVPPSAWIQTTLVELAGGNPVWTESNPGGGWLTVNFEQIAAWNPEKIFLVSYRSNPDDIRSELVEQARWQALWAVQTDNLHVFPVDYYSWDQPDPRWALGLQWLATRIQPDLFSDLDLLQIVYTFFELAYRLNPEETNQIILNELWGDLD